MLTLNAKMGQGLDSELPLILLYNLMSKRCQRLDTPPFSMHNLALEAHEPNPCQHTQTAFYGNFPSTSNV